MNFKSCFSSCFAASAVVFLSLNALGQSTVQSVYNLFQTNCAVACHNGTGPGLSPVFATNGDLTAFRNNLVNATPLNPAAVTKGYKLVDPGHPHTSFLLHKMASTSWDDAYGLTAAEGNAMPDGQPALAKEDIELVRQWILYGAPATGQVVNPQTLYNYYNVNGMARMAKPNAPAPGTGFQVHMGPFFLNPSQEIEFYLKHRLKNADLEQVTRMDVAINDESHHYLLFEFEPGADQQLQDGLRTVNVSNVFPDETKYIVGWVDSDSTKLPNGTAFYIEPNTVLDLNYHLLNYAYNGDSILAGEAYVNFFTDNTEEKVQMHSELKIYPPFQLLIYNNGQTQTFTQSITWNGIQDSIYVWFLSTHTHKYGTDYDIYRRNPDGTRGEQLYEGFYNTTYAFDQGYYDWAHPANLYLDQVYGELLPIKASQGLIQEAKFRINNPNEGPIVTFGLTTEDEMMLVFIQYTLERLGQSTDINSPTETGAAPFFTIFPNPSNGATEFIYQIDKPQNATLQIFNSMGQLVETVFSGTHPAGNAHTVFSPSKNLDPSGLYLIRMTLENGMHTGRFINLGK